MEVSENASCYKLIAPLLTSLDLRQTTSPQKFTKPIFVSNKNVVAKMDYKVLDADRNMPSEKEISA